MLTLAMICLLLAITGDVYLAGRMIEIDQGIALAAALGIMSLGFYLWFVHSLYRRKTSKS